MLQYLAFWLFIVCSQHEIQWIFIIQPFTFAFIFAIGSKNVIHFIVDGLMMCVSWDHITAFFTQHILTHLLVNVK